MNTTTERQAELAARVSDSKDTKVVRPGTMGTRALITLWPDATQHGAGSSMRRPAQFGEGEVATITAGAPQPEVPEGARRWAITRAVRRVLRPLVSAMSGRRVTAGATLRFPTADGACDAELARLNQEQLRSSIATSMRDGALAITTGIAVHR